MSITSRPLRVVVAGLGNMGRSHALAYHRNPGFEIAALVNRSEVELPEELAGYDVGRSFEAALAATSPDVASINTYSDSHADYAVTALEAGCHVFVEKPLATTVADARPVEVRGMGLRLSGEIDPSMYNYGHLQVLFEDGSVGWYEAGWGPMISETAFFVKDVISPRGCVSIVMDESARSDDIDTHTKTSRIRIHRAELGAGGSFAVPDELLSMQGEPGHQALCEREQQFLLDAIRNDVDLDRHMDDAVKSLAVCLAADESVRTGKAVRMPREVGHGSSTLSSVPGLTEWAR